VHGALVASVPRVILGAAAVAACALSLLAVPAFAQDELKPENPVGPVSYTPWHFVPRPEPKEGEPKPPEPQSTPAPYSGEALVLQPSYIGRDAAEPTMGVDKDGVAFYAAGAFDAFNTNSGLAHTKIYRSSDGGVSWQDTTFGVSGQDFPPTTLDPYVYVDSSTSRVFSIDLAGAGSFLMYSDDKGETWQESAMAAPGVNDHQTFFSGPPPKANPLITTQDTFPNVIYYCVNTLAGSSCSISTDGGRSFAPINKPFTGVGGLHGHGEVDFEGRAFIPHGEGPPSLAVTEDGGVTWEDHVVAPAPTTSEPHTAVATDKAGNVYYVWFDSVEKLPYLAVSRDHGKTWGKPMMIAPPGVHDVNFPIIVAGDPGKIAITFPGSSVDDQEDESRPWHAWMTVSTNALDPNPLFVANIADDGTDPLHRGTCEGRCSGMFDFIDLQLSLKDGTAWGTFSDTCTQANDCHIDRTAGLATDAEGLAVRQLFGPKLIGEGYIGGGAGGSATPVTAPSSPSKADRTKPKVRSLKVVRKGKVSFLRWKLSERASVKILVKRGKKTIAKTQSGRPTTTGSLKLGKLKRGRYAVALTPTDAAGNRGATKKLAYRAKR
jgi:hypothetical protein